MLRWLPLLAALVLASPLRAQLSCTANGAVAPPLQDCGHEDLPEGGLCLYDNYPTGQGSTAARLFGLAEGQTFVWADAIDVLAGPVALHSLELRVEKPNPLLVDDVLVRLWDDDASDPPDPRCSVPSAPFPDDPASRPCTVIESWTIPGTFLPDKPLGNDCVLTSTLQPLLVQGKRYWVSVGMVDGTVTAGRWFRSFFRTSEWVFSNQASPFASWKASIEDGNQFCPPEDPPPCEQRVGLLAVTVVPEPGALAAGATALAAGATLARRRSRA